MDRRLLALLGSTGCPFVFGPPDLSRVDRGAPADADTDTDADTDADADTDTDGPTGDSGPSADAPTVLSFAVAPHVQGVTFLFSSADPQQDYAGGEVVLSDGSTELRLLVPDDIPGFDANGVNAIRVPRAAGWLACDDEVHEQWTLTIRDFAGNVSAPAVAPLDAAPVRLPEIGNRLADVHRPWEGQEPPFLACVTLEADPADGTPDGIELSSDLEPIRFDLPAGRWRAELAWAARIGVWFTVSDLPVSYPYACDVYPVGNQPAAPSCLFEDPDGGTYAVDPRFVGWDSSQYPPSFDLLFVLSAD
jgi:hypothetical protein